jgi:hypothetical protein
MLGLKKTHCKGTDFWVMRKGFGHCLWKMLGSKIYPGPFEGVP